MSDNTNKTVMYIIKNESDARKMCEILAINGYNVRAETDTPSLFEREPALWYLVYVEGGSVENAVRGESVKNDI